MRNFAHGRPSGKRRSRVHDRDEGNDAAAEAAEETHDDRRRYKRVAVNLPGRYMLEDGSEFPCVCIDVSVGGVRLRGLAVGRLGLAGDRLYRGLGRHRRLYRAPRAGLVRAGMRITARKGERVEERIAWIMGSDGGSAPTGRGLSRQCVRQEVELSTFDGRRHAAQVTDISKEGAAVLTDAVLEAGERVRLETRRARVVRLSPAASRCSSRTGAKTRTPVARAGAAGAAGAPGLKAGISPPDG